jgi:hypothetical protein
MTKNQIENIFYYLGMMLINNKIISTSPDYLIEKSIIFFGVLGKNEFVSDIKNEYFSQRIDSEDDFWSVYCKAWGVKQDNYEIMNIINFILSCNVEYPKSIFKNFEKYIGEINIISDLNLRFKLHPNLLVFIDNSVNFNDRYLKLISI